MKIENVLSDSRNYPLEIHIAVFDKEKLINSCQVFRSELGTGKINTHFFNLSITVPVEGGGLGVSISGGETMYERLNGIGQEA